MVENSSCFWLNDVSRYQPGTDIADSILFNIVISKLVCFLKIC